MIKETIMQKRLLYTVLCFCLTVFVLTGCAGTNEESTPIVNTSETVSNSVEPVVEDTKEEPIPDSTEEEIITESAGGSVEEVADADETVESADIEEVEPEINEEDAKFNANLSEYLDSVDRMDYDFESHGMYKVCFYADDINGDGFPEVFQYRYRDLNAVQRDFSIIMYNMTHYWDQELRREVYVANVQNNINSYVTHDMSAEFGRAGFDISYTRGEENILCKYESCFGRDNKETTKLALSMFRDGEMLHGGYTIMEKSYYANDQSLTTYLTYDASYRNWGDEEHFNNFDSDSVYEVTIHFGEDELWATWQEAVEHLGELP